MASRELSNRRERLAGWRASRFFSRRGRNLPLAACSLLAVGSAFSAPVLFPNGDFSIAAGADWNEASAGAQVFSYPSSGGNTSSGAAGDGYVEIVSSEGGGFAVLISNTDAPLPLTTLGLIAGNNYEFSYDMLASVAGANKGGVKIESWTASGIISDTGDLRVTAATTGWETHTVTYLVDPTATHLKIVPLWTPNETVGFDNILVDDTPVIPAAPRTFTWDGNDDTWETALEWDLDEVPSVFTIGDSVIINAGTSTYAAAAGDLRMNGALTISNTGTWVQSSAAGNWIKIGEGNGRMGSLTVSNGGTFDTGGATGFYVGFGGGTGDMTVDGGTVLVGSDWIVDEGSTFTLSSGSVVQSSGQFFVRDADGASVSGGTLKVSQINFDGSLSTALDFTGGLIHVTDPTLEGIDDQLAFDRYIDFTGSDGTFFLEGGDTTIANCLLMERIRRNGVSDPSAFSIFERNGGVEISLANVPKTITATATGGGSISPAGSTTVAFGGNQAYTISPDSGFILADVQVDGVSLGLISSFAFNNVISSRNIEATFVAVGATFDITAIVSADGSISPAGVTSVPFQTDQTYTITPDTGFEVRDVLVDGTSVGAVTSYTFTNVIEEHTIEAEFGLEGVVEILLDFGTSGGSGNVFEGTFDGSTDFVGYEISDNGGPESPSQDLGGGVTLAFTNVSGWNNSNNNTSDVNSLNGDHLLSSGLDADDPVSFTLSGLLPTETVIFEILDRVGSESALVTFDGLASVLVSNDAAFTDVSAGGVTGKSSYTGSFTGGAGSGEGNIAAARITILSDFVAPSSIALCVTESGGQLEFDWNSLAGATYNLVSSVDLSVPVSSWAVYNDGSMSYTSIPSGGLSTTLSNVAMVGDKRFFAVIEQ